MPSRRSHTKSHHGCLQCKQRRVKCDETTPQCQRCARRQMPCSFLEHGSMSYSASSPNTHLEQTKSTLVAPSAYHNQPHSDAPTPLSLSESVASQLSTTVPIQQPAFTHLDLELIHYYSTQTYMTMTSDLTAHLVWRDVVFQEGLKQKFLLHALMATAALHKATAHAEDSGIHADYIKVALSYQNAALAGYIPALNSPNKDNAVALFILSALLTVWLFGSKKFPEALNGVKFTSMPGFFPNMFKTVSGNEPTHFLEIMTLVSGINTVVQQTIHWLQGSGIDALLKGPLDQLLPPIAPDIEASFQKLQHRIQRISSVDGPISEITAQERIEVYLERLDTLRKVSRIRTVLQHDQQVFAWPVSSDAPYLELLRQRDPIAMALFIHWAACFRCLDHLWWAKGWSYRLVKDVCPLVDETWADVLVWPRKEVGLD